MNTYFEQLITTYQNLVFSICLKMTGDYFAAEDLAQETFLSAFSHMDSFDGKNEKSWICRIATNKCIDYLKSASKRMIPSESVLSEDITDPQATPEECYMQEHTKKTLLCFCNQLKAPYDEVARLYFYEEHTVEEISGLQNKNPKTVQTQIYRARAMLRKKYKKEGDFFGRT